MWDFLQPVQPCRTGGSSHPSGSATASLSRKADLTASTLSEARGSLYGGKVDPRARWQQQEKPAAASAPPRVPPPSAPAPPATAPQPPVRPPAAKKPMTEKQRMKALADRAMAASKAALSAGRAPNAQEKADMQAYKDAYEGRRTTEVENNRGMVEEGARKAKAAQEYADAHPELQTHTAWDKDNGRVYFQGDEKEALQADHDKRMWEHMWEQERQTDPTSAFFRDMNSRLIDAARKHVVPGGFLDKVLPQQYQHYTRQPNKMLDSAFGAFDQLASTALPSFGEEEDNPAAEQEAVGPTPKDPNTLMLEDGPGPGAPPPRQPSSGMLEDGKGNAPPPASSSPGPESNFDNYERKGADGFRVPAGPERAAALAAIGLPSNATAADVQQAFRRFARTNHPDKAGSDPAAYERFNRTKIALIGGRMVNTGGSMASGYVRKLAAMRPTPADPAQGLRRYKVQAMYPWASQDLQHRADLHTIERLRVIKAQRARLKVDAAILGYQERKREAAAAAAAAAAEAEAARRRRRQSAGVGPRTQPVRESAVRLRERGFLVRGSGLQEDEENDDSDDMGLTGGAFVKGDNVLYSGPAASWVPEDRILVVVKMTESGDVLVEDPETGTRRIVPEATLSVVEDDPPSPPGKPPLHRPSRRDVSAGIAMRGKGIDDYGAEDEEEDLVGGMLPHDTLDDDDFVTDLPQDNVYSQAYPGLSDFNNRRFSAGPWGYTPSSRKQWVNVSGADNPYDGSSNRGLAAQGGDGAAHTDPFADITPYDRYAHYAYTGAGLAGKRRRSAEALQASSGARALGRTC